jgi:triacylglycerol esterase/lipase EstA (alpha/beta hydrolase family)
MSTPTRRWSIAVATIVLTVAAVLVPGAEAGATAVGPPLDVPASTLAAALTCHGSLTQGPTPVLLVPGTTLTAADNFDWNYEKVFTAAGRSWCALNQPDHGMADIQVAGEYVVYALRTMHARAHRKVSVVGFSQGGMVPRWALKWWPDTRATVDDLIGIDPSNHGTLDADAICLPGCAPAFFQQASTSKFLAALNKGAETYAGISYTQMYTATDEVVVPNVGPSASSALHTGAGAISNTLVQSICPVHVADHLSMGSFDPLAYALVLDALNHAGPANSARINRSVCTQASIPGVSLATVAANFPRVLLDAGEQVALYPHVAAEPALAAYARG